MAFKDMMTVLLLLLLVFVGTLIGTASAICHPKDFGHGATVCLCSATQVCDGEFPASFKISAEKSVITSVRTTKAGDRFALHLYNFTKEEPKSSDGTVLNVKLSPTKKYQSILGFGGAFTDTSGINIGKLPAALQERLLRDYFADDGIGFRMGRVPIGGSDFSPRAYSLDDHENDDTLEQFALQKEDLEYKIPYIKMAQKITSNQVKLFGSAWSSPIWMKTNHEFNHGGFLKGEPGTKYYKLFAKYLTRFLEEYQKQSVPMWGLTVVNEPEFGFDPNWGINVLGMNATMQRDFVKLDLGPQLKESGFGPDKVKLMINDDNVNKLEEMTKTVLADAEAAKFVSGVAFHWYASGGTGQIAPLDALAPAHPGVFFLSTEACELRPVQLGNWTVAELYARDIINDLNHHTAGWVEWNMVLDPMGGPSFASHLDASLVVDGSKGEYYKQPSFYAMGHFARFVLPDSVRLHHEITTSGLVDHETLVTVFQRPDGAKVATALNRNAHLVKIELHDPDTGYAALELAPNSIESFIWH